MFILTWEDHMRENAEQYVSLKKLMKQAIIPDWVDEEALQPIAFYPHSYSCRESVTKFGCTKGSDNTVTLADFLSPKLNQYIYDLFKDSTRDYYYAIRAVSGPCFAKKHLNAFGIKSYKTVLGKSGFFFFIGADETPDVIKDMDLFWFNFMSYTHHPFDRFLDGVVDECKERAMWLETQHFYEHTMKVIEPLLVELHHDALKISEEIPQKDRFSSSHKRWDDVDFGRLVKKSIEDSTIWIHQVYILLNKNSCLTVPSGNYGKNGPKIDLSSKEICENFTLMHSTHEVFILVENGVDPEDVKDLDALMKLPDDIRYRGMCYMYDYSSLVRFHDRVHKLNTPDFADYVYNTLGEKPSLLITPPGVAERHKKKMTRLF